MIDRFRYAIEVRDRTWFQDLAYNFFADNNMCMVWSKLAELSIPAISTTDFLYLRFIEPLHYTTLFVMRERFDSKIGLMTNP